MSVKHAKAFYDTVTKDQKTKDKKLYNAVRQAREQVIHLARSHGYHFSYEELNKVLTKEWGADFEKNNPKPDKPMTCSCF